MCNCIFKNKSLPCSYALKNQITNNRDILSHPDEFADICQLPRELIRGFSTIWTALRIGLPLCPEKFRAKCKEIKDILKRVVPWVLICPTLHKGTIHILRKHIFWLPLPQVSMFLVLEVSKNCHFITLLSPNKCLRNI